MGHGACFADWHVPDDGLVTRTHRLVAFAGRAELDTALGRCRIEARLAGFRRSVGARAERFVDQRVDLDTVAVVRVRKLGCNGFVAVTAAETRRDLAQQIVERIDRSRRVVVLRFASGGRYG